MICIMCGEELAESLCALCLTCNAKPLTERILALYVHLDRKDVRRRQVGALFRAAEAELKEKIGCPERATVTQLPGKQVVVVRDPVTGDIWTFKEGVDGIHEEALHRD